MSRTTVTTRTRRELRSAFAVRLGVSTLTCQALVQIGGPHDGCAEFAPDVEVPCAEPATARIRIRVQTPDGPFVTAEVLCAAHRDELRAEANGRYGPQILSTIEFAQQ